MRGPARRLSAFNAWSAFAALILFAVPALAASASEWRLESTGAEGMVLIWQNHSPGNPAAILTRSAGLAVPAGSVPSAGWEILEERAYGDPAGPIEPPGAQGAPEGVRLSSHSRYRDLEVAALTLNPLRKSASGTFLVLAARIRVAFSARPRPTGLRAAFPPPPENPAEGFLASWLLNYVQSRGFRTSEAAGLAKAGAYGPSAGAGLARERLVVLTRDETIEVLDYEGLKAAGVPVGKTDPRTMRLFRDGKEVPIYIQGEDDGRWNPEDYLEFIGARAAGQSTYRSLFASATAFILTWEGSRMGLRAPAVPVFSRIRDQAASAIASAPPFRTRIHLEEDSTILRIGSTAVEDIADLGSLVEERELSDFWYWASPGAEKDALEIPFRIDHTPAPAGPGDRSPSATFRITLNLKGITNNPRANPDHHMKFLLNGFDITLRDGTSQDAIWEGQESYTWTSPALDPAVLKPGQNKLVLQKVNDLRTADGKPIEVQDAFLNFMELDFPSTYAVPANRLAFANAFPDSLGLKLFTLTGFTEDAVSIWDLAGRKLTGYHSERRGSAFEIGFQDSLAGSSRYAAVALSGREKPAAYLDTLPADLLDGGEGADYLVITQKELLGSALDSLLEHHRKQGLRCRVVMANHLYQAFGDGTLDPAAIRRFVSHAYHNWPRPAPVYLLILGETSLWFDKQSGAYQRNIVPTNLINIQGWGVAANDDYFAKVSGSDDLPDIFVGRIPVASREALSKVVRKTLALENDRAQGHWSNKALLIAGYEPSFTRVNDRLQASAVAQDRQFSRLDLHQDSRYYRPPSQRENFYDQLDSGFNLVNFVGHGGGSVWSDAGILTLKALGEGRLKGEFPIPLVSSVTCLTGYFEDVAMPSLGEEMIRLERGGAANFYGASGYISSVAGEALAAEILAAATSNAYGTTGAIVHQAETMVRLRTGNAFLPILAEFNLLGDPALKLAFPERAGDLALATRTLAGSNSLESKDGALDLASGRGLLTLFLQDSAAVDLPLSVVDGKVSFRHAFDPAPGPIQNGKAIFHYWDGKETRVSSQTFSTLDWLIDSVAFAPASAAPGDSVKVSFRLGTAYSKAVFGSGIASFAVAGEKPPLFPAENQIPLVSEDGIHIRSRDKLVLSPPPSETSRPTLHLVFRMNVEAFDAQGQSVKLIPNLSSRIYSLPLSDLARLSLADKAFHLPIQDELGLWVRFRNAGLGKAADLKVALNRGPRGVSAASDTLALRGFLKPGQLDSLFFPLRDSMLLDQHFEAVLLTSRTRELALQGNSQDTVFHKYTRLLSDPSDSLRMGSGGPILFLSGQGKGTGRVFAEKSAPEALPAHLAGPGGAAPEAYRVEFPDWDPGVLGVAAPTPTLAEAGGGPSAKAAWHYRDFTAPGWLRLDSLDPAGAPARPGYVLGRGFRSGLYALLINRDDSPPLIQFSSRGQVLLPDDYVPLRTPINIVIRDGEGVDMALHPPQLSVREQDLDSTSRAGDGDALFPTLARINFLPKRRVDRDSIEITARDISGNETRKTLAYRLGDDLAIRNLGSYPNPFADTAVFVYSLTDFCERVELKVYSRAGRLVRTLEERNAVGYREVLWDGHTNGGRSIANGLYFLKVTARSGGKEAIKIFKLFKKQRK